MNCKSLRFSLFSIALLFILSFLGSCQKFEGDQTVPAYIRIDSIIMQTNYEEEGAPTSNITDAWVYINDEAIGAYELPAVFPVLASGLITVRVDPGIELNGIAALRTPYPFYKPIVQDVMLVEGEEVNLNTDTLYYDGEEVPYTMTTGYYENLEFVWMEDFEDPSLSLDSTSKSLTDITRTNPANSPEAFLSDYSKYSGLMVLTTDKWLVDVATNVGYEDGFVLPKLGQPVFLEVDFKNNNYFTAGFYAREQSQIIQNPVVNMNPTSEWKKIYINLTPGVSSQVNAIDFNIFFGSTKENAVDEPRILIDNVKLIHRK
ncbi:MAG: hypothetical protein V2I47_01820 [Bacteroidales bacterium]|nr:hypothetical protein [Bacteroidales bacterium]